MFKLVIQDDEGKTTVVPLIRDEITIGRKEGNTIRLTERNVSRRHARILRNNGEVQIEDLGSYNGIRVNNARIAERVSLRISDQVQIGDYKLYLKAEGVEQVDDARTMPIERVDNAPPTEVMPALQPAAAAAPTTPLTAQPAPAPAPAPAAAPPRAVAPGGDLDTGGRPVATAAQVAALTQPAAYGKLVVVSSNFAGKEFELTRPQMIVGRTDENDIVIAHRSISRNHAKVTRDPETQRYTIGDLQSSNGVRVNGQDYSKVELRRGDIVDLGHVRLRFIEPGEDFVFERDAVIADVEEPGGKRGLLVAAILAVLVLGGVAALFVVRGGHKTPNGITGSGDKGTLVNGGGSNVAVVPPPLDAAATPQIATVGSNGSDAAGSNAAENDLLKQCDGARADKKWPDLQHCADQLQAMDPARAKELRKQALDEGAAEQTLAKLQDATRADNLPRARKLLDKILPDSVYRDDAEHAYDTAEEAQLTSKGHDYAKRGKCNELASLADTARTPQVKQKVLDIPCQAQVAAAPDCSSSLRDPSSSKCRKEFCDKHGDDSRCGGGSSTPACNAQPFIDEGNKKIGVGDDRGALAAFEGALRCKYDPQINRLAYMSACNAKEASTAKAHYQRLSASDKKNLAQMCIRNGIQVP